MGPLDSRARVVVGAPVHARSLGPTRVGARGGPGPSLHAELPNSAGGLLIRRSSIDSCRQRWPEPLTTAALASGWHGSAPPRCAIAERAPRAQQCQRVLPPPRRMWPVRADLPKQTVRLAGVLAARGPTRPTSAGVTIRIFDSGPCLPRQTAPDLNLTSGGCSVASQKALLRGASLQHGWRATRAR